MTTQQLATSPHSSHHRYCERCQLWVQPDKPHWFWRASEIFFWGSLPAALIFFKALGFIAIPFILMFVGGLAGPLREKAGRAARCPECDRNLPRTHKKA